MQRLICSLMLCIVTLVLIPGDVPELSDAEFPIKPEDVDTLFEQLLEHSHTDNYAYDKRTATSSTHPTNAQRTLSWPLHARFIKESGGGSYQHR